MNWKDEEIDGLFKQAKMPEAPAFEEAFWTEMEAMLPPQQKRRKAGLWWISAATVALLAVGGFALWTTQNETTDMAGTTAPEQQQAAVEQLSAETDETINPPAAETANTDLHAAKQQRSGYGSASCYGSVNQPGQPLQAENTHGTLIDQPAKIVPKVHENDTTPTVDRLPVNRFLPVGTRVGQSFTADPLPEHLYIQAGAGIGQSAITDVAGHSDLIQCYTLGVGVYGPRAGKMYLNLGLQGRVDMVQNLSGTVSNPDNTKTDTRYGQLYAIETPLTVGLQYGRNSFAVLVTPGFQLGFTGTYRQYDLGNNELRSGRTSGKIASGKTLTMEIGLGYMRKICPNWYAGASCNADILRPFGEVTFDGTQRTLPVNAGIFIRRTF